ncbi:MAG: hypothetical protein COV47_00680 [Candidatus Diapherotrites archaeon CG11_big_fil_rev_8_21_14_0_20_37_9]|nr:MAG: hypothetical protein COV47_00680 [Candidatus Diapherotrites archaeon CG11_big_fil_rev_8_21_14_0_20_37_9]
MSIFSAGITGGIIGGVIGIIAVLIGIIGIFLFASFGALIGAITGWILQHIPILGDMVVRGFAQLGIANANLAELGATLGFIAGFFKSAIGKKDDCC